MVRRKQKESRQPTIAQVIAEKRKQIAAHRVSMPDEAYVAAMLGKRLQE